MPLLSSFQALCKNNTEYPKIRKKCVFFRICLLPRLLINESIWDGGSADWTLAHCQPLCVEACCRPGCRDSPPLSGATAGATRGQACIVIRGAPPPGFITRAMLLLLLLLFFRVFVSHGPAPRLAQPASLTPCRWALINSVLRAGDSVPLASRGRRRENEQD